MTRTTTWAAMATAAMLVIGAAARAEPPAGRLAEVRKQFGPPVMWVAKPAQAPTIDGKLDDACWASAQSVELGFLTGRREAPTQKTIVRMLADDKAVYFAVQCFEAKMDQVQSAGAKRDDDVWQGDDVEFFLDPGHKSRRYQYVHVSVSPKGVFQDVRNKDAKWNGDIQVKAGAFEGGWAIEMSVAMKDLVEGGKVPKIWGVNVNRQRPELGEVAPAKGISTHHEKLKEPDKYREPEDTSWSPTWCNSSHIAQCFGHAVLEAGAEDVEPPAKLFELIFRNDFDEGKLSGFMAGKIVEDDNFRGPGKCAGPGPDSTLHLSVPLMELDDVTMMWALKMPGDGRFQYFGRTKDNEQAKSDIHEVYMTPAAADARPFPAMDEYDTHGSMMAWKSFGKRRIGIGPWTMMTGQFSEPTIGDVMNPGKDWVVVRTRPSQFRNQRTQGQLGLELNYPRGLTFAGPDFRIDDIVIFRGMDVQPPDPPADLKAAKAGDEITLSWSRSKDNTLTAYYQVMAGQEKLAETYDLSAKLPAAAGGKDLTVIAVDFYGNASAPSAGAKAP